MTKAVPETFDLVVDHVSIPETSSKGKEIISTRKIKPPKHLQDYHCYSIRGTTPYPITDFLNDTNLSFQYQAYINAITKEHEPTCYTKAMKYEVWNGPMIEEITNMEDTKTWYVCSLPLDREAVGCKWIYKVKYLADGTVERYGARLVAKGYTQKKGWIILIHMLP